MVFPKANKLFFIEPKSDHLSLTDLLRLLSLELWFIFGWRRCQPKSCSNQHGCCCINKCWPACRWLVDSFTTLSEGALRRHMTYDDHPFQSQFSEDIQTTSLELIWATKAETRKGSDIKSFWSIEFNGPMIWMICWLKINIWTTVLHSSQMILFYVLVMV